jgi:putative ABC transport system permease protein
MSGAVRRLRSGLTLLTGTAAGASVVLAVLVAAGVFVAVAAPRQSVLYRTQALQQILNSTPASGRAINASIQYTALSDVLGAQGSGLNHIDSRQLDRTGALIGAHVTAAGVPLQPAAARWSSVQSGYLVVTNAAPSARSGGKPPRMQIVWRDSLSRFARISAGRLPSSSSVTAHSATFQVALTSATAARFGLRPGSVLRLGAGLTLVVSGLLKPLQPGSTFWTADPAVAAATYYVPPGAQPGSGGFWQGSVFIGRSELDNAESALNPSDLTVTWEYPLALGGVSANQAGPLNNELINASAQAGTLTNDQVAPTVALLTSGLFNPLNQFVQTDAQIGSLLSLLYVSLAIVAAVVLLLGCRLLIERRSGEFALMRARGAGRTQLGLLAFRAGAVVVIPAALVAAVIAVLLTPGDGEALAWWLAGLTVLVGLAGVPLLAARRAPSAGLSQGRADRPPSRIARARRLVAEATLAAAAIGGLIVLRQQGGPPLGGINWYTSAAPVLIAIPVAIVVVHGYPFAVGWLSRLAGRRHGVPVFVGLARAARASVTSVLAAFALVLVLTVIAFGGMLRAAVVRGEVTTSWTTTGADAVLDASQSFAIFDPAAQRAIARVPGVRAMATLSVLSGIAPDGSGLAVIAVDPARYARFIAHTPLAAFPAAALAERPGAGTGPQPVPALLSPAAANVLGRRADVLIGTRELPVREAGVTSSMAGAPSGAPFIVLPSWALGRGQLPPNLALLTGPDIATGRLQAVLAKVQPAASIRLRSAVLAALADAPLSHAAQVTFVEGVAAAGGFGLVIVLIVLALGARPRELTLARLFTMGLSPGQARRLVLAEALPWIIAATAGGVVTALALVPLIGPAIDLSVLIGSSEAAPVRADPGLVVSLAAGLLILAVVALFAQSLATRIRGLARALRVGE